MNPALLYPIGCSESCRYASAALEEAGYTLTDHPSPEITHLLLDVPSFQSNSLLRDGSDLKEMLRMLPKTITVIGGNLDADFLDGYHTLDLLKDPFYLAKNAAITADCALKVAVPYLKTTFEMSPVLILGWGRIGKCLARLLSALHCPVTVAARKDSDRAMLEGLGYRAVDFSNVPEICMNFRILFNTVPNPPICCDAVDLHRDGIVIDLASAPGIQGRAVIPARGLPGKYAPESSGKLIAETILRLSREETI